MNADEILPVPPEEIVPTPMGTGGQRRSVVHRVADAMGVDAAITFTILARGSTGLAAIVTVLLITRFLSGAEQGYYYTFGSLVALQIVFELGFSFVILQMATHERAHLTITADGTVTGGHVEHARLASVLQKSLRWYSVAALLMLCSLVPAGLHFFATTPHPGAAVAYRLPWFAVALAASVAFQIDPLFSFLEGCGYVPQVARTRWRQALLGAAFAWVALLTHHGLFAPAMVITGQVLAGLYLIFTHRRLLIGLVRYHTGEHRIRWSSEVWPFQWRIAVSWISGYFIFQLFVPVLFRYWGPVAAGRMGMSVGIINLLTSVAISWVNTKAAPFGALVSRRNFVELDRIFFRVVVQSFVVCAVCALMAWCTVTVLNLEHAKLASRMLSPLAFGIFLLSMVVNNLVFSEAIYLRAHKQEKMVWQSVGGAVLIALSTYFFGKHYGAMGMVSGYLVVCVLGLVTATATFVHYRRIWHE